ncbi:unnamed protein product [Linum trigynum]|uniref:Uncharacterized protein n=1 Tax=Linum trigynum TaxID=586398 RepID=A0AAV2EX87_9ROSI
MFSQRRVTITSRLVDSRSWPAAVNEVPQILRCCCCYWPAAVNEGSKEGGGTTTRRLPKLLGLPLRLMVSVQWVRAEN